MKTTIELIRQTRRNFLELVNGLSIDDVNRIPEGFNNNIAWNLGHIVISQQVLCYKLSSIESDVDPEYFPKYGRGTRPEQFISAEEFELMKSLALQKVDELEKDYETGTFKTFNAYTTSYGAPLACVEDAIRFVAVHEGVHYGYALALKRAK